MGTEWWTRHPNPSFDVVIRFCTSDAAFQKRDSSKRGSFRFEYLPSSAFADVPARMHTPLLANVARLNGLQVVRARSRSLSASRSRSQSANRGDARGSEQRGSRSASRDRRSRSRSHDARSPRSGSSRGASIQFQQFGDGPRLSNADVKMALRHNACKDFLRNACTRGATCRFQHLTKQQLLARDSSSQSQWRGGRAPSPKLLQKVPM